MIHLNGQTGKREVLKISYQQSFRTCHHTIPGLKSTQILLNTGFAWAAGPFLQLPETTGSTNDRRHFFHPPRQRLPALFAHYQFEAGNNLSGNLWTLAFDLIRHHGLHGLQMGGNGHLFGRANPVNRGDVFT